MNKSNRKTVRFDDRTWMLLKELAGRTGTTVSTVIRSLAAHGIEKLIDEKGDWKDGEAKKEEE
ncbi:hypothetical protein Barb6_00982 [Bacteroidales bacterium Barb6]|nr:hypothetical protein Barb6_01014 [Bacteroidales bacterium Barb6]OAV72585.1 hypothetical protein Barb6_00982 [Bacteroidales bacterium Barb6]